MDDRPAGLPAQPRARPQLRQVPRAHRRQPLPAHRGPDARHVLALGAAARRRHDPGRDPGRDRAHGHRRGDRVRDRSRTCRSSRATLARDRLDDRRQDAARPRRRAREGHRGLLLPEGARPPATPSTSGCPRPCRRTRSGCGSRPTSRASASTRTNPPLAWEAWTGDDWEPCELDSDTTGGLNRDGDVVIHVPRGHVASLDQQAARRGGSVRGSPSWRRASRVQRLAEHQGPRPRSPSAAPSTR